MTTKKLQHRRDRLRTCCGNPKPLAEFRVVGPLGRPRSLSTCKSCQKRMGLGAACSAAAVVR